jgi:hypothetical protein
LSLLPFLGLARPTTGGQRALRTLPEDHNKHSSKWYNFWGEPPFYDGARQQRALAIAQEAAQAAGVRLSDYVDDVVYTTGRAPFFGVVNDRRVLALNQATLRKTRAGQLIDSVHELSHARHSARFGYQNYRSLYFSSLSMRARIEILVESRAQRTVERYLGGLSPQQRGWTSRYLNWWGQYYP